VASAGEDAIWPTSVPKRPRLGEGLLIVNQTVILIGYWWAGLLDREVWRLTALYAAPAIAGLAAGMLLFTRLDRARFRQVVFVVLFVSGLVLLLGT
jgi:uncharacterized membrane protein YfcA